MSTPASYAGPCDEALASVIVEGKYTPALIAIGQANVLTLQRAVEGLAEAARTAHDHGKPGTQYKNRTILCRARINLAAEAANASF